MRQFVNGPNRPNTTGRTYGRFDHRHGREEIPCQPGAVHAPRHSAPINPTLNIHRRRVSLCARFQGRFCVRCGLEISKFSSNLWARRQTYLCWGFQGPVHKRAPPSEDTPLGGVALLRAHNTSPGMRLARVSSRRTSPRGTASAAKRSRCRWRVRERPHRSVRRPEEAARTRPPEANLRIANSCRSTRAPTILYNRWSLKKYPSTGVRQNTTLARKLLRASKTTRILQLQRYFRRYGPALQPVSSLVRHKNA